MSARTVIIVLLLGAPAAGAASIERLDVEYEEKRYTVDSVIVIAAPIEAVFEVLADYDRFERVSSVFKDSHYVTRENNGNGVIYTRVEDCIAFFCKSIERTESLSLVAPVSIATQIIPAKSDVRYGNSLWTLTQSDGTTLVRYQMVMEPDFWIPPIIGPFLVKRFLRAGSGDAADRVERLAIESLATSDTDVANAADR